MVLRFQVSSPQFSTAQNFSGEVFALTLNNVSQRPERIVQGIGIVKSFGDIRLQHHNIRIALVAMGILTAQPGREVVFGLYLFIG